MEEAPLIASDKELGTLMGRLIGEPCLALDTEASSFHRFHERIGLIQLSNRTETYLLDPLSLGDMSTLGGIISGESTEIVIHDADYDLRLLKRMYGFRVRNIFDTLIAAELLNEPGLSLAALLKKYFDIQLDKRFQKADWSRRPLSSEMLAYAAMDTRHLIALRDLLAEQLKAKGRWEWAVEEFGLLTEVPFRTETDDTPGYLRIKGAKLLKPKELAILKELHAWRDGVASRLDRAPFMVVGNDVLIGLAKEPTTDRKELSQRKGIGDSTMKKNATALLQAVKRGLDTPREEWPKLPRPKRHPRDPDLEDRLKRLKAKRDELMTKLELRPGVVCPNQVLMEIARTLPGDLESLHALPGMRKWQVETFGRELLSAL